MMITGTIYQHAQNVAARYKAKKRAGVFEKDLFAALTPDQKKQATETIRMKLKSGKKLSPSEMNHLRENDPDLYEKAKRVAQARSEFESRVKSCRTKAEVAALKAQTAAGIAGGVSAGTNADTRDEANMTINAVNDEHGGFMRTRQFKELPADERELKKRAKSGKVV